MASTLQTDLSAAGAIPVFKDFIVNKYFIFESFAREVYFSLPTLRGAFPQEISSEW